MIIIFILSKLPSVHQFVELFVVTQDNQADYGIFIMKFLNRIVRKKL